MGMRSTNSDLQTIIEKIEACAGSCSAQISSGETVETKCMHTPVLVDLETPLCPSRLKMAVFATFLASDTSDTSSSFLVFQVL